MGERECPVPFPTTSQHGSPAVALACAAKLTCLSACLELHIRTHTTAIQASARTGTDLRREADAVLKGARGVGPLCGGQEGLEAKHARELRRGEREKERLTPVARRARRGRLQARRHRGRGEQAGARPIGRSRACRNAFVPASPLGQPHATWRSWRRVLGHALGLAAALVWMACGGGRAGG